MATKAALTEEAYLRTSFPGVDQEFRDGELLERSMPEYLHSKSQRGFNYYFEQKRRGEGFPVHSCPELRLRLRPGRYAIPDVSVFWPDEPTRSVPDHPPFIAIEILSPDDRMSAVRARLQEYSDWGVPHVWLADPESRTFYIFDGGLREVKSLAVPELGVEITAADVFE